MKLGVHVEHLIAEGNPLGPAQTVQQRRAVQALQRARQCAQPLNQPLGQGIGTACCDGVRDLEGPGVLQVSLELLKATVFFQKKILVGEDHPMEGQKRLVRPAAVPQPPGCEGAHEGAPHLLGGHVAHERDQDALPGALDLLREKGEGVGHRGVHPVGHGHESGVEQERLAQLRLTLLMDREAASHEGQAVLRSERFDGVGGQGLAPVVAEKVEAEDEGQEPS